MFSFIFPAFEIGSRNTDERFPAIITSSGYPNQLTDKYRYSIYVTGVPAGAFVTFSLISPPVQFHGTAEVKLTSSADMAFNSSVLSPGSIPGDQGSILVESFPDTQDKLHPIFLLKFTSESVYWLAAYIDDNRETLSFKFNTCLYDVLVFSPEV